MRGSPGSFDHFASSRGRSVGRAGGCGRRCARGCLGLSDCRGFAAGLLPWCLAVLGRHDSAPFLAAVGLEQPDGGEFILDDRGQSAYSLSDPIGSGVTEGQAHMVRTLPVIVEGCA